MAAEAAGSEGTLSSADVDLRLSEFAVEHTWSPDGLPCALGARLRTRVCRQCKEDVVLTTGFYAA
jgi:hypothetical protein